MPKTRAYVAAALIISVLLAALTAIPVSADSTTSTLPVLYIETANGRGITSKTEYTDAIMYILLDGANSEYTNIYTENYTGIQIRGRGNSTWGQSKKPYHIRLNEKADLFGMGASRHWILLANAMDGTHLRNTLSYNLSGELGLCYIKNIHVELVLNGVYQGLYQLTQSIKIANDRVDITDWEQLAEKVVDAIAGKETMSKNEENRLAEDMKRDLSWITSGVYGKYTISDYFDISHYDTTGGYLIELDEYYDEISKFTTSHDVPIMIKSPEYLYTNSKMFSYISGYIQDMENALYLDDGYNNDGLHYSDYMDVDSFIDYWIVNQAFKSVELLFKSCFMYKDSGGLLTFGPVWDMDWSSGNHVNLYASSATYNEWNHSESQDREYWYRAIYDDPYFIIRIQDRWAEVKDRIAEYIASIDEWKEKLSTAADANNRVWGELGGWDFAKECSTLKAWMKNRLDWMDKQLAKRDPNILGMGIKESEQLSLVITNSNGYTLSTDTTDTGVAADLYYGGSGSLGVKLKIAESNAKTASIYVNGELKETTELSGGSASFKIDASEMFTSDSGRRNCVTVITRSSSGKATGIVYKSLKIGGGTMHAVSYIDSGSGEELPGSASFAEGESFNLSYATISREGYIFSGWSEGGEIYPAGSSFKMGDGDLVFTAVWEQETTGGGAGIVVAVVAAAVLIAGGVGYIFIRKKRKNAQ